MTFIDISAVRLDFFTKFYTTVEQPDVHFNAKFGWNVWTNDKIKNYFNHNPFPFLSVPRVVYTGSLLVALKRAASLVMRMMRM